MGVAMGVPALDMAQVPDMAQVRDTDKVRDMVQVRDMDRDQVMEDMHLRHHNKSSMNNRRRANGVGGWVSLQAWVVACSVACCLEK